MVTIDEWDFESVSSANSDTPAFMFLSFLSDVLLKKSEKYHKKTLKKRLYIALSKNRKIYGVPSS